MPRKPRKKEDKTKAERIAEEYFPMDENSLKNTIEKKEKNLEIKNLEKIEILALPKKKKKATRTKKTTVKNKTKKTILKEFSPKSVKLKKKGYELIITEKPQAALKIASALGKSVKRDYQKIPYYEIDRNGKKIVVVCAVGHLFTLTQKISGSVVPIFDIGWVPNYMVRKKDFTKRYYDTILKLVKDAGEITVATDYDIEGEVIGLNVVRFVCGQKDANRMKFSTLTTKELNDAYDKKSSSINWGHAIAGETRHYLDWFYGINLSRALMNAIKTTGAFRIMSIGRVQGPTLNLIVQKERQIQAFEAKPYWQIYVTINNSHELELKHNKDIFNKKELEKFKDLVGKTTEAITNKREQIIPPNPPFDLTNLQTESYKLFGLTPSRTLQIAQSLYLSGIISYPRTSSQKLPDSIGYQEILKKLSKEYDVEKLITRKKPIEGRKSDQAHPSIHPTGEKQILSGDDEKVYQLIVKRFLSLFCDNAIVDNKTVFIEIDKLKFSTRGSSIRKKGWMEIYPSSLKEKEVPDVEGEIKIANLKTEEKETQPPKRYSAASIISELEKRNLGTKATRSSIIETLYDRNYIKEKSIEATSLGISLINTLDEHSPIIIDEKLTREFEREMEDISNSKKDFEKKEKKVIDKAKETITKIAHQFEEKEKEIGDELLKANAVLMEKMKEENKLNICPKCKKGDLAITYSKKTRRHFVACNKYPECKTTYSLPPNSLLKKLDKNCEKCGFQMLMSLRRSKRPWIFCFNSECETNRERIDEYKKRKQGSEDPS